MQVALDRIARRDEVERPHDFVRDGCAAEDGQRTRTSQPLDVSIVKRLVEPVPERQQARVKNRIEAGVGQERDPRRGLRWCQAHEPNSDMSVTWDQQLRT